MNAAGHRQAAYVAGVAVGLSAGLPWWETLALGALATVTAGGPTSPDMDQRGWYRALLPRRLEGHRKLSHWWGLPAAGAAILAVCTWWHHPWWAVIAGGLLLGWTSHLAIDWAFGAPSRYRGAGIPMSPTGGHRGLLGRQHGLRSDGLIARVCTRAVFPFAAAVLTAVTLAGA